MSLEERWGFVEFENLKGVQLKEPRAAVARQPMQDECKTCQEEDGVGRMRLKMRMLRQLDEVVAEQPPIGVRSPQDSEKRAGTDSDRQLQVKPPIDRSVQ